MDNTAFHSTVTTVSGLRTIIHYSTSISVRDNIWLLPGGTRWPLHSRVLVLHQTDLNFFHSVLFSVHLKTLIIYGQIAVHASCLTQPAPKVWIFSLHCHMSSIIINLICKHSDLAIRTSQKPRPTYKPTISAPLSLAIAPGKLLPQV